MTTIHVLDKRQWPLRTNAHHTVAESTATNTTSWMRSFHCFFFRVNELDGLFKVLRTSKMMMKKKLEREYCLDNEKIIDDYISMFLDFKAPYSLYGWHFHNKAAQSHCWYSRKITQMCTLNRQFVLGFAYFVISHSSSGTENFIGLNIWTLSTVSLDKQHI